MNTTELAEDLVTVVNLEAPKGPVVLIVNPSISSLQSNMKRIWLFFCLLACFIVFSFF